MLQKYRHYQLVKLINTSILTLIIIKSRLIQHTKFTYSPLVKPLEKQTKKRLML